MRLGISLCLLLSSLTYFVSIQLDRQQVLGYQGVVPVEIRLTHNSSNSPIVKLDIWQVRVKLKSNNSWLNIDTKSGVYQIASEYGTPSYVIAEDMVPKDKISQIHIILGPHNGLLAHGMRKDIRTNRLGTQSIKIPMDVNLSDSSSNNIELVFDVEASIRNNIQGQRILKPTIKWMPNQESLVTERTIL